MSKKSIKKEVFNYTAVFEEEAEGGYSVTIPALPGCISEGDTFEEATKNITEAAELYLEVLKDKRDDFLTQTGKIIIAPIEVRV